MINYLDALKYTKQKLITLENGENQAMWLLSHILDLPMHKILLNDGKLNSLQYDNLIISIEKLLQNYPLQYLIGKTEFFGYEFYCNENVLIPRNDTEILVNEVVNFIGDKSLNVLDMCCGSGCIGITIAKMCKNTKVTLCDISDYAIELSKKNAIHNNVDVNIMKSDMFANVNAKIDVLVSNPPYIKSSIIPTLAKNVLHEPILALDGDIDGLKFYKQISNYVARQNIENVFLEIGNDQGKQVSQLFNNAQIIKDLYNNDRVVKMVK